MGAPAGGLPAGRVALLFTDIQGSTALLHALGAAYRDLLDTHDRILREVWAEHGGVEFGHEGDSFCVAFADHERAVAAAASAQSRLASAGWPDGAQVAVRMALHSGEPAIRGDDYWGVDVHYAARLGAAAHGGQVLLSAEMRSRVPLVPVESLGRHGLRDFSAPRELFHLALDGVTAAAFPPPRTIAVSRSNLPTISTPIIGRESVTADIAARLTTGDGVVTLVGPGGVGKTRTAVDVGERLVDDFADGVAFVALAALHGDTDVAAAIATAVGAELTSGSDPAAALQGILLDRRSLIILDNVDHLPGLPALVARLVAVAPRSRWLVTSQAPLRIRAETVVRLGPLDLPSETADAELESVSSVALFLERVRSRAPDFVVPDAERNALVRLCHLLDGMPLALELAAARAPVVGLTRLADAIAAEPLTALGSGPADLPERQRGLHAALAWTTALLGPEDLEVFLAGSTFAQAWTLDNIEQMVAATITSDRVWDAVTRLCDLSLVVQRGDGRLTMPERVRRHAEGLLAASGREQTVRGRHAAVVCDDVDRLLVDSVCHFSRAEAAMDELTEEVLHALDWASTNDEAIYRGLLATARCPLYVRGRLGPFVADMQAFARADGPDDREHGVFLMSLSNPIAGRGVDLEEKTAAIAAAEELLDRHGLVDDRMNLVSSVADLLVARGDHDQARTVLDRGVIAAFEAGRADWAGYLEDYQALVDIAAGDLAAAEARFLRMHADPDRDNSISVGAATYLGDCAFERGDFAAAVRWFATFLRTLTPSRANDVLMQVYGIAASCAALRLDATAVELWAAVSTVYPRRSGRPWSELADDDYEAPLNDAKDRLSPLDRARAGARGGSLGYEDLVARALEVAGGLAAEDDVSRVERAVR